MDQQRGRSPSAGHQQPHLNQSHSPSPHFQADSNSVGLGLGLDSQGNNNNHQFLNNNFNPSNGLPSFNENNEFINQQGQAFSQDGLNDSTYAPSQNFNPQFNIKQEQSSPYDLPQRSFTQELLDPNLTTNFNQGDFPLFSTPGDQNNQYDPSFFMNELPAQTNNQAVQPSQLDMNSPQNHTPTPPSLLQPDSRSPASSHNSPNFSQGQFQSPPNHSRNASLGPESAAYPQGQNQVEWGMMPPQFQGHRRTPSEYSDVSVSSAAHSPNLGHHDAFESIEHQHSPMQRPQDSSLYNEVLGIGSFSLSDTQIQHSASPRRGLSPAHSPAISPRLGPQQLPSVQQPNFMLNVDNGFGAQQNIYGSSNQDSFNQMDMGQAQQMVPPVINVDFAPNSRQSSFEPPKPSAFDSDALTPPERGRGVPRRRAVSDPYRSGSNASQPHTPSSMSPGLGSELAGRSPSPARSLSPHDRSGASSPNRQQRRHSASPLPNRDYILGLADPDYQAASSESGDRKRVQKHPATFQCTLCPKRFTRAYNLRSHLRTHTDERPFVCTVCGKAFARQHDRKRHEGLHSGEKKFVCKGELKQGGQWGCGRRFARADALGRHFRSEAGRICIKPLLDEEAIERQRLWNEQRMQNMHNMQTPQPIAVDASGFPMDASGNYTLPAALLAQYPALATLSWSELPQGDVGLEDDPSGRSSFDASGSEYYDEGNDDGYLSSGPRPQGYGQPQQMHDAYNGYSSDIGGR